MNLFRAMQAFAATVRTGSMRAAADELTITPAMVGQHIAALESRLGTRLLNRTTRSHSLTEFGTAYLEHCHDILQRIASTEEDAQTLHSEPRGRLRITAPVSLGTEVLAPALARFQASAPDVVLDVTLTDRNVDLIDEGIDVAFRVGNIADSPIISRPLGPYRMALCAAPTYLARNGTPAHPNDLAEHQAIGFSESHRPWRFMRDGEEISVQPKQIATFNSGLAMVQAGCQGMGLVLQPHFLLEHAMRTGEMIELLGHWQRPEKTLSLLYYRDRLMTARLRAFIHFSIGHVKATF